MNKVVLLTIFLSAVFTLFRFGIAKTFVYIYLPALLFFFTVPMEPLPSLPNLTPSTAVGYPMLLAVFLRWHEVSKLKLNVLDVFFVLMMFPPMLTAAFSDTLWDAISRTGDLFFVWVLPYFAGRMVLLDADARRHALYVLCTCAIIIGAISLVEFRLKPYWYARSMQQIGLSNSPTATLFTRFGFMRAQSTMAHSIDLGVCGVLLGAMVLLFNAVNGRSWAKPLTLAGVCGAGLMVVSSISFTAIFALTLCFICFFVFTRPFVGRWMPLLAVAGVMLTMITLFSMTLSKEISLDRPADPLEQSQWMRDRIVQDGWNLASTTGLVGSGRGTDVTNVGVGSVDNAYILFILQFGWLHLAAWVVLMLMIGYTGNRLLGQARTPSERIPVAAAMAGSVATFFAMYTVFYGFVYALLLCVMFGMIGTMTQLFTHRNTATTTVRPAGTGRGFEVMSGGTLAHAGGRR